MRFLSWFHAWSHRPSTAASRRRANGSMNPKRALLCVEPVEHRRLLAVDPFVQTAKLFASEGGEFDRFGFSVAGSGDMIVVGSVDDDKVGGGRLLHKGRGNVF